MDLHFRYTFAPRFLCDRSIMFKNTNILCLPLASHTKMSMANGLAKTNFNFKTGMKMRGC